MQNINVFAKSGMLLQIPGYLNGKPVTLMNSGSNLLVLPWSPCQRYIQNRDQAQFRRESEIKQLQRYPQSLQLI